MATTDFPETSPPPFDTAWFQCATAGLDEDGSDLLARAVQWVRKPLTGLTASTGEPLDEHCAEVVCILAGLGTDAETRASALITVLPLAASDNAAGTRQDPLRKVFGAEVVSLVQGTRALLRLGYLTGQAVDSTASGTDQKEMQRKMLLAMAADLRIVLMRLASRLQSLRWYASSKTACPSSFASETMELYTPLANRLGIWQIKWEMEDLAFRFLEPMTYKAIARQLEEKRVEREAFISAAVKRLEQELADAHIPAQVSGRPKHIYSIWNKMRNKNIDFSQLFDLRALRIIVQDERACYAVLALAHSLWTPVSDEFDDYISRPKPNGYRSLHTVVTDTQGRTFEIQIRTQEMHEFAEYGMAAHWRYKEAGPRGGQVSAAGRYDQKIAWMRQLLAWEQDGHEGGKPEDPTGTQAATHPDSTDRIYVMTPQARVMELPAGATPVDFAYYLHTDLGHRCRGARVDGQLVPLLTKLETGQTVEVIAAKSGGPSRDWLNPQLGFLASPRSRAKVRAWFNAIELQQRISQGQTMVEKELQRLGKTAINMEQLAQQLDFAKADDLYVAVAKEEFSLRQIDYLLGAAKARAAEPASDDDVAAAALSRNYASGHDSVVKTGRSGVLVVGVDSLMTQLARCCRPAPPDTIVGFVTRGRGVSIHRRDCAAYAALAARQPERLIDVDWGSTGDALYPIDISIHAQDRPHLLRDLSDVFAKLRLNVISINTHSRRSLAHMVFTVEIKNGDQISRALAGLNELPGVSASRH
ncbi:RelA/SpoT family protein [Pollutimonas harenae]|uniref:GTP pyrophosphokinase n=1 Tax=Pollutimonas harenae TaxID=657015 RepID=A0A853H2R1_9BURK|nr:bifunctional (p)ppGpp synthetase/guanosine-3',5'-bis(diphosphate) 3'-pyrophosphohydrolase [Pollutimonas harenae]NYT85515.1 bifunctional (p)ppGpp synthetase/guanosine-3',5'-bis(diphosphate) 3'-pyrophosphohydrolase [Pollutimonas harenae]TEA70602.1 bifunctional (p)ppGpp synthetase/guanosine-3',5'-bis(diphosphate) 3'-pyrophosphohydrolase [Pollutimonas harenae]